MMDSVTKLLEAIAALLGALAWPALVIFLVVRFTPQFRKFLDNLAQASSVKVGLSGVEFSTSQKMAEAAAALVAAQAKTPPDSRTQTDKQIDTSNLAQALQSVNQRTLPRIAGASILWVDDSPQNNVYERRALEALGMRIVSVRSTPEALDELRGRHWDVVISDMGRPEGGRAGYDLLAQMRQMGLKTPYIIYTSSNSQTLRNEAAQQSAFGTTNNPTELFQMVIGAISMSPA